jgi:predicted DNA-binding transcriptional regulator AlpA
MTKTYRTPVDTKGASAYTGFPESRLNKLRCDGNGPVFIKRGRAVRYDLDDIDAWLDSLKRRSTSAHKEVA